MKDEKEANQRVALAKEGAAIEQGIVVWPMDGVQEKPHPVIADMAPEDEDVMHGSIVNSEMDVGNGELSLSLH